MKKKLILPFLLVLFVLSASCSPSNEGFDSYWVILPKLNVHKSANVMSDVVGELKFGDKVLGHESNLGALVPEEWLEIRYGDGYAYVEKAQLCNKETMEQLKELKDSVEKSSIQAIGVLSKKSPVRMSPERTAKLIDKKRKPADVEVFDRIVTEYERKGRKRNDAWNKVRMKDGRVGYAFERNIRLTPPKEIRQYTSIRKTVAWLELREKVDEENGLRAKEYIVAYRSQGTPDDADYSRIELYTFDTKKGHYGTALAKSSMLGKLPLTVKDIGDGKKIVELRELVKKNPGKMKVYEYSFPQPITLVKEYEVDIK